jgi:esterase/lipase
MDGVRILLENVSSKYKEAYELKGSSHVLTLDKGWRDLAEVSYQFLVKHGAELAATADEQPTTSSG